MNSIFQKIFILIIIIIIILYFITDCDTKIYNKPVWPCPYNENRLKNIYIKESAGEYTSLSLFDVYSFTHICHGILFYYILRYILKINKKKMIHLTIIYAIIVEISWEILENLPMTIKKYRKNNLLARNYAGDSIINSLCDILSMIIGFMIAYSYPEYGYILFIITELLLYYFIKDNLILNIYEIFIM